MKRKKSQPAWTPFQRCTYWIDQGRRVDIPAEMMIVRNSRYTVHVEYCKITNKQRWPFERVVWLSIKRNDRAPIHDWRELQRIKNELCGEDYEAVEIYPRESRLVDTSNQYHLWVFPPDVHLPFGYSERQVALDGGTTGAVQRPFALDQVPPDAMSGEAIDQRITQDPHFGTRLVHERIVPGAEPEDSSWRDGESKQ